MIHKHSTRRATSINAHRLRLLLVALSLLAAVSLSGCGGAGPMSQEELKRRAVKRTPDVEAPPADTKSIAKADDAKAGKLAPQAKAAPRAGKAATVARGNSNVSPPAATAGEVAENAAKAPAETRPISTGAGSDTQSPPATPLTPEERARRTVANMDRIGIAFQKYMQEKTVYPPRAIFDGDKAPLLSWRVALLPYLGYKDLYAEFNLNEPWNSRHNKTLLAKIPSVYQSPERFDDRTNYLVPLSVNTTFGKDIIAWPSTIEDGPRNTVFVVEADDALAVPWTQPREYDLNIGQPVRQLGSLRGGSFYIVWGTGEVGRILTTAPLTSLKAMFTYDAGEDFFAGKIDRPLFAFETKSEASPTSPGSSSSSPRGAGSSNALSASESLTPLAQTYQERSADAAAGSNERAASQWFYASALVSQPGGAWVERYRWLPALKRPAPILRIGVGLQYRGPKRSELEQKAATSVGRAGSSTWSSATGEIGKTILATFTSHLDRCAEGSLLRLANDAPAGPARNRRSAGAARAPRPAPRTTALLRTSPGESLAPGIHFIAVADEPVLRIAARREGVEVLALVDWQDIGHKQSVRLELIDAARDVPILQLPWIDSEAVADSLANPLGKNPFPEFLRQLSEFLEQQLTFQPFPEQIQPRHVAGRLEALAASKPENPLAALAEMRYYRERKLVDDTQLLLAYQTLLGQKQGSELILGDGPARERVLKPWLPIPEPTQAGVNRTAVLVDD